MVNSLIFIDIFNAFSLKKENFFEEILPNYLPLVTSFKHHLKEISSAIKQEYYAGINFDDKREFDSATQEVSNFKIVLALIVGLHK